ncbi:uncharacterized protein E0L32_010685 [Thyridium curvatum]|uniref:EKC/KEOPS complex subunit BUD32 n=1 Tax=Thyridium curvatum TaxID=1093900 RepID=A0A507AM42_9PEZI|nr:uncharacterized protein E0L32_010685 [Thyridium curvatum]TPX07586.1 hypothetical protein E0L32_010685 [Thyridium curvatum]
MQTTAIPELGSIIGIGASCFASIYDQKTVLKGYEIWVAGKRISYFDRPCEDALRHEEGIYNHLGEHPQILRCLGLVSVHDGMNSLRLERAPFGNVRQYIERNERLSEPHRLQMALDVAVGLSHIHSRGVQHADLSCRNLFLFDNYRVKIGDFGGSIMQNSTFPQTVCEEPRYELPCRGRDFEHRPVVKRELFALGSAIYEITYWTRPFPDLQDTEVETRYANDEFPSLSDGIGAV